MLRSHARIWTDYHWSFGITWFCVRVGTISNIVPLNNIYVLTTNSLNHYLIRNSSFYFPPRLSLNLYVVWDPVSLESRNVIDHKLLTMFHFQKALLSSLSNFVLSPFKFLHKPFPVVRHKSGCGKPEQNHDSPSRWSIIVRCEWTIQLQTLWRDTNSAIYKLLYDAKLRDSTQHHENNVTIN